MQTENAARTICAACLITAACGRDPQRDEADDAGAQTEDAGVPLLVVCDDTVVAEEARDDVSLSAPAAASDGNGTALVWAQEQRISYGDDNRVLFARLPAVESAVGEPLTLSNEVHVGSASVTWTGAEYGVAWLQPEEFGGDGGDRLRLARLDQAGAALAETAEVGIDVCQPSDYDRVVWTGGEYALFWSCGWDGAFLARFPPDGAPRVDAVDVPLGSACALSTPTAVAWNGEELALAWEAQDCESGSEAIWFARLMADGTAIGDTVRATHLPARPAGAPVLAWVDRHYCVVWRDGRESYGGVYAALMDSEGEMITDELRLVPEIGGAASDLQVAWSGAFWGAAWNHRIGGWDDPAEIVFVPFDPRSGEVGEPVVIMDDRESGWLGDLVWDSGGFEVAWREAYPDEPDEHTKIHASRVCESR